MPEEELEIEEELTEDEVEELDLNEEEEEVK